MPLFKIEKSGLTKLASASLGKEKTIQKLFEENLSTVLNVDFLHSEYATSFGGRIDTLGIDKNGSPGFNDRFFAIICFFRSLTRSADTRLSISSS